METENLESLFLLLHGMPLYPGKYLAQVENTWSWDRAMLTADGWELHERQMPSWGGNEVQSIFVELFIILDIPRNIWWQMLGFLQSMRWNSSVFDHVNEIACSQIEKLNSFSTFLIYIVIWSQTTNRL